MNKRQTRYTPFKGEFKMPVDEFCQKYGLDLDTVMTRMNVRYWEDFDALVIPQNMGMTSADKIRRALMMMNMSWTDADICRRLDIPADVVNNIKEMDPYMKSVFIDMDNYFFLNPKNVDLNKVFKAKEVKA